MSDSPDLGFTKEGMIQFIERLRGGAKNRLPYDQIRLSISMMMSACARQGTYQSYRLQTELAIHRVRLLERPGAWFRSKADLGPCPADKTLGYGRCLQPNRPVGYWSLYEDTALAEMRAELGQQYVISTFTMPTGSLLLPVGEFDYFRRTGQTYLGEAVERSKTNYTELRNREDWALMALFDAFLADEFIRPVATQTDYKMVLRPSEWVRTV